MPSICDSTFHMATDGYQKLTSHSGFGTSNYQNYVSCFTLLDAGEAGKFVNIVFEAFDLEAQDHCE